MPVPNIAMLGEVSQTKVAGLLQQRRPAILDTENVDELAKFEARVRGAAVEVVLLTGADPDGGPIRDLAIEAIAMQTASEIEYSEYPEQQVAGDVGRGYHLHQRYLELLALLRGELADGAADGLSVSFQGSYPYSTGWNQPC